MVRFVHTSDWQLGMTRAFLGDEAQARYSAARVEAIEAIGRAARERGAAFVVVAGDVFETNLVPADVVRRALDAMRDAGVPFYLLPGNHDPAGPGSVWGSRRFVDRLPGKVQVLGAEPVEAAPGTWVAGVPWRSKQAPPEDAFRAAVERLAGCAGERVLVAHGQVEFAPDAAVTLPRELVAWAIRERGVGYVALGDRHSVTDAGCDGRAWYSGTPEQTDYDEREPGCVLVVELEGGRCAVEPVRIGRWRFVERELEVRSSEDLRREVAALEALPEKTRTVLRLRVRGSGSPALRAALAEGIRELGTGFAAIEPWERYARFHVVAEGADWEALGLTGFAAAAAGELNARAAGDGPEAAEATEALALLYELARGGG
ncbi:metallophosphoesterase family protein [Tepidiforma sp.]|uniref:metallophosphoesterase family protein n=1 Tax=Tepidiforma sp. TaxID=2682230 RepID=UPI002ADE6AF1|nr:metallophosphoesterase [Tepidiforma sp.]